MTDGVYRDPIRAREERVLDLKREIAEAEEERAALSPELQSLSAACKAFLTPNAAAPGWYRAGKILGCFVGFAGGVAWAFHALVSKFHP